MAILQDGWFEALIFFVFVVVLLDVVAKDILSFTIPNRDSLILLALFLCDILYQYKFEALSSGFLLFRVLLSGAILIFGFIVWYSGLIGGGDVKLIAVLSLWFETKMVLFFLLLTAIFGGVVALLLILLRKTFAKKKTVDQLKEVMNPSNGIPYGVAISIAAVICFVFEKFL